MSNPHVPDEETDKVNPIRVILMLAIASLITLGTSFLREYFTGGNELRRVIGLIFYAFVVMIIAACCVGFSELAAGKKGWRLLCGIWLGFFTVYVGWVFFIYGYKGQLLISPGELWDAITDVAKYGIHVTGMSWKTSYSGPAGSTAYVEWAIDAAIIIGAAIAGALKGGPED